VRGQPTPQPTPWWQFGPFKGVSRAQLPSLLLASLGGLALLFGLLFFVWYSVEQGWLSPAVRVTAGGLIGVGLLSASWRLAAKGQRAVAGGLGGAGLGAWFAAWLVARHVHEFVGSTEAFVALALGCGAALVIAGAQRLRIMGWVGALGAFVTPIATSDGTGSLNELMIYQAVVIVALVALEIRRRWSELLHIAVSGTWILMISWFAERGDGADVPTLLGWAGVMFVVFHVLSLDALRARRVRSGHVFARLLGNGAYAWIVLAMAASVSEHELEVFAWGTLAMALVHGTQFSIMRPRGDHETRSRMPGAVVGTWAWLQLFVFAAALWGESEAATPWMALWWCGMALAMAVIDHLRSNRAALLAGALPTIAVILWSFDHSGDGAWPTALGFMAAALPVWLALVVRNAEGRRAEQARAWLLLAGGVTWAVVAWVHTEDLAWGRPATAISFTVLLASSLAMLRGVTRTRVGMTLVLGLGLLVSCYAALATDQLFDPTARDSLEASARGLQLATLLALVALSLAWVRGFRELMRAEQADTWMATAHDSAGLLAAFSGGLAAMIAVSWLVTHLHLGGNVDPSSARSLAQAGYSSAWAACALFLLIRGLREKRSLWRIMALTWLALTGLKLVFVDLSNVDLAWRVISFVSLGACLLAGAHAYRRFTASPSEDSPEQGSRPFMEAA
jgi:uncharacterized membrane protein